MLSTCPIAVTHTIDVPMHTLMLTLVQTLPHSPSHTCTESCPLWTFPTGPAELNKRDLRAVWISGH